MRKNSMQELVNKVSVDKKSKAKQYAYASEWPKCSIAGCPLTTTIKDDKPTCGYHHREHGYNAECITEAIKQYHPFIKKYNEMIYWNVRTWNERKAQILGWDILPATDLEMQLPTLYLSRLKKFIDKTIKERAEEFIQGIK